MYDGRLWPNVAKLAFKAIEIVGIDKKVMVGRVARSAYYWLNHDPSGLVEVG